MEYYFRFNPRLCLFLLITSFCSCSVEEEREEKTNRPNFLLLMSDNHYYAHLGCYGESVIKTPTIDAIAKTGVLFEYAFCGSPSCTPARAAMLAGQDIWRLGEGANLWSTLADTIPIYTDLLEKAGYFVGHDRKGWGPGNYEASGRVRNPGGYTFEDLNAFLEQNKSNQPWCYWLSSRNPHRPFNLGAGVRSGMDINAIEVPPYLPDVEEVRSDIADYYEEIQQFDLEVKEALQILETNGEIDHTILIVCGDNGWMMPRGLANLYDAGTRVPLIISWPKMFVGGRKVSDFVSLNDLAPTILTLADLPIPDAYTARSLVPILTSKHGGQIHADWDKVVMGRERHAICRKDGLGYPGRAIRTKDYLFIHNYFPDRWPAGDPPLFGDIDLHMLQQESPTKEYMMLEKDNPMVKPLYEMAFLKRPAEELFDLQKDPYQMVNVANADDYQKVKLQLREALQEYLTQTKDPRALGIPTTWDIQPYYKEADWVGKPRVEAQNKLGLDSAYHYR